MKNPLSLFIAIVIALVLLVYMFLFQVRYDEVAVLTTFGQASEGTIKESAKWPFRRWPWPIQKVTRYSTRLKLLEGQREEQQTANNYAVIVNTYVIWRIQDPLRFFRKYQTVATAESQLDDRMRDVKGEIGNYRFDELVNTDSERLKLTQVERRMRDKLRERFIDDGILIEQFGIRRILLPEAVTTLVFEQMKDTRERLAANIRSSGDAEAQEIKSRAESIKNRILAFANGHAKQIRSRGDKDAASFYKVFGQDEVFATFLSKIEAIKAMFKDGKGTIIMHDREFFDSTSK